MPLRTGPSSRWRACLLYTSSGTAEQYAYVNGVMYAVPNTPSTQMLFYRRDLFTSAIYRRMYPVSYTHLVRST